jgi:hypothetical protein
VTEQRDDIRSKSRQATIKFLRHLVDKRGVWRQSSTERPNPLAAGWQLQVTDEADVDRFTLTQGPIEPGTLVEAFGRIWVCESADEHRRVATARPAPPAAGA